MSKSLSIPDEVVVSKIYLIRDKKVMLDDDLAELYRVETRRLNEQVKRNLDRFPQDFMFQLMETEWEDLKSQNATSSWGGRRKTPYAALHQCGHIIVDRTNKPNHHNDAKSQRRLM